MKDFIFENATKIIFGKRTEETVGEEIKKFDKNILLVHYGDEYIKKSGILERIASSLTVASVEYTELTGIKPNPILSTVRKGIEICRKKNIGFILALGGGSVIDTAKAIAAGVLYEGDVWERARRMFDLPSLFLPTSTVILLICIRCAVVILR